MQPNDNYAMKNLMIYTGVFLLIIVILGGILVYFYQNVLKLNEETFTVAKASSPDDYDTYQIKKNKKAPKECTLLEGEEE